MLDSWKAKLLNPDVCSPTSVCIYIWYVCTNINIFTYILYLCMHVFAYVYIYRLNMIKLKLKYIIVDLSFAGPNWYPKVSNKTPSSPLSWSHVGDDNHSSPFQWSLICWLFGYSPPPWSQKIKASCSPKNLWRDCSPTVCLRISMTQIVWKKNLPSKSKMPWFHWKTLPLTLW